MICSPCHKGILRQVRLTLSLSCDGKHHCDEAYAGERATAFLLAHRALAPHAEMTATIMWRADIV
jgi:hypothetical protein